MKFGAILPTYTKLTSIQAILETAAKAEEFGFDSIWTTDHVVIPHQYVERFGTDFYDPLIVLTYLAGTTRRVKLGTTVIIIGYRNPLVVAKMVATLDVLSGGRVIFGAAAGWMEEEFQILKVPFKERGELSDEYLRIMKELWTHGDPTFNGKYFQFSGVKFLPQPTQKPHPPIWIGGNSRRAIRRAVELGEAWHPNNAQNLQEGIAYLRRLSREKGRRQPPEVGLRLSARITDSHTEASPLTGSPSKVINDIKQFESMGVTYLVLSFPGDNLKESLTSMGAFAQKVSPSFS